MKKITAIIIARNCEDLIADCIESVSFLDEIIIVDNKSTDRTAEIAKHLGTRVVQSETDSFAELRNIGLENAKTEIVFYLDADERVDTDLKYELKKIQEIGVEKSAYLIKRKNYYFQNVEWPKVEKLERLFVRDNLKNWRGRVHETPVFEGELGELNGFLNHYTHRDLTTMLDKTIEWSKIEADLRLKSNHPRMTWWRFPRVMLSAFLNSFILQKGYKAGTAGLVESIYQSFSMFITYARLWELQNEKNNK